MTDHLHQPAPPRDQRKAIELRARDYIRRSAEARRAWVGQVGEQRFQLGGKLRGERRLHALGELGLLKATRLEVLAQHRGGGVPLGVRRHEGAAGDPRRGAEDYEEGARAVLAVRGQQEGQDERARTDTRTNRRRRGGQAGLRHEKLDEVLLICLL